MAQTKKQKAREWVAKFCEEISRNGSGKPSQIAKQLRATNRRIEKRKKRIR